MNNYQYRSVPSITKSVQIIIIINIVFFILMHILPRVPWGILSLVPRLVITRFMIWQLVTYMFLHMGLFHLVFNMLMLYFFGSSLEAVWGRKEFLKFFFFTGIGAGLCGVVLGFFSPVPVIGASGVIFGLLTAQAVMNPNAEILIFFIFPMKMKHAVFVIAGICVLAALASPASGIIYLSQLGGGLFGYFYLKSETIRRFALIRLFGRFFVWRHKKETAKKQKIDDQIDEILDKVSKHGIHSLTKKEQKILEDRSRADV